MHLPTMECGGQFAFPHQQHSSTKSSLYQQRQQQQQIEQQQQQGQIVPSSHLGQFMPGTQQGGGGAGVTSFAQSAANLMRGFGSVFDPLWLGGENTCCYLGFWPIAQGG